MKKMILYHNFYKRQIKNLINFQIKHQFFSNLSLKAIEVSIIKN